jgi:hypothetical protein
MNNLGKVMGTDFTPPLEMLRVFIYLNLASPYPPTEIKMRRVPG